MELEDESWEGDRVWRSASQRARLPWLPQWPSVLLLLLLLLLLLQTLTGRGAAKGGESGPENSTSGGRRRSLAVEAAEVTRLRYFIGDAGKVGLLGERCWAPTRMLSA